MSSEGDALGASYSRGERDYAGDATTLADPHVPAGRTGRPGISFLVVSAWATALVALWVYRRAVVRALQAARAGTLKPRAALAVTVDPPGVEDGRWTQHWDVSPRPSTSADDRANDDGKTSARASATSGTSGTSGAGEKKEKSETEDDGKTSAASFPGVETTDARSVARAAADVRFLCDSVPRAHRFDGWRLLYRAARDGFSLKTLYRKCAGAGAVVTLVEDERGGAFGAFTSDAWRTEPRPYGDGRCFVFSLRRDREHGDDGGDAVVTRTAYRWDPDAEKTNYAFQAGRADSVSLGGGNGFALWLDGDLLNGASAACDTFGTPGPLACAETFKVRAVEVWGFEPLRRVSRDGAASERRE